MLPENSGVNPSFFELSQVGVEPCTSRTNWTLSTRRWRSKHYGLIALSGGNLSVRKENGDVIVTPSGTSYETMQTDDLIVLNAKGERIEGTLRESVDTVALRYIFDELPDSGMPSSTRISLMLRAIGLIGDIFPPASDHLGKRDARRNQRRAVLFCGQHRYGCTNRKISAGETRGYTQAPRCDRSRGGSEGSAVCRHLYGRSCKGISGPRRLRETLRS